MPYPNIFRAVFDRPWAILPSRMEAIIEVLELRNAGQRLSEDEIRARLAAAAQQAGPRAGAQGGQIAVIPMYGVLSHRMNMLSEMSGGTSVQQLRGAFRQALADPAIAGIVFDVDSPGGAVDGIPELAAEIRAARGQKPLVAVSNTLCASAAYWLAAQCDEILASPSSLTGSVGVYMAHVDESGANEQDGLAVTYIHAGEHKVEGNSDQPLTEDARAYLQSLVDSTYGQFTADVAKGRGLAQSVVKGEPFGQGRVLTAQDAVRVGMADRVGTLEDAVGRISRGKVAMHAEARAPGIVATGVEVPVGAVVELDGTSGEVLIVAAAGTPEAADVVERQGDPEHPVALAPVTAASEDEARRLALARARARERQIPA